MRGRRPHLLRDFLAGVTAIVGVLIVLFSGYIVIPTLEGWIWGTGLNLGSGSLGFVSAPFATIDEQQSMALTANSPNLTYTITAVAQNDSDGYGPAYVVSGLTAAGYWYQVGIAYNWVASSTGVISQGYNGYIAGFEFLSQVWNPGGQLLPTPPPVRMNIANGDTVQLSLVTNLSTVLMQAWDEQTGASESQSYSSFGSDFFLGVSNVGQPHEGFSGPMTEWYHAALFNGTEQPVSYVSSAPLTQRVFLVMDAGNISDSNASLFFRDYPVDNPACGCTQPFSYEGLTVDVDGSQFTTGYGV